MFVLLMSYIQFDKTQLINLEYSLQKELIRSNRAGSFSASTILGCNTRKYHGLLICPQPQLDGQMHVLLSKVDESVIQQEKIFNLGVNRYPGTYHPRGHKYVRDFSADKIPLITYRVGGVVLTRETMFVTGKQQVLIRYTLLEAHSPTKLRIQPFLAFRNIHRLSKRNMDANTRYDPIDHGVRMTLYAGYDPVCMQLSVTNAEYVHSPDWFNDLEYAQEAARGYDAHEDLFVPGFFEFSMKKGGSVVFSASTDLVNPKSLTRQFNAELNKRISRDSFQSSLQNAAEQFLVKDSNGWFVSTGFPWLDHSGRYGMISLPGLSRAVGSEPMADAFLKHQISVMKGIEFMECTPSSQTKSRSADTALWFFRSLQLCFPKRPAKSLWQHYGKVMEAILNGYAGGQLSGVDLHENGLLHIGSDFPDLTWMNARNGEMHIIPRFGYVIEVNALWYNAVCFALDVAKKSGASAFVKRWQDQPGLIKNSFINTFWLPREKYLADFVHKDVANHSVRPNQLMAVALPYSPLDPIQAKHVLDRVDGDLLTPRGIRSLSPRDPNYKGHYTGNARERDQALHQGSAWVWLLGPYSDACFRLYGKEAKKRISKVFLAFEEVLTERGIGTVSEIFDGDPPHASCGAIAFSPSVAELFRIGLLCGESKAVVPGLQPRSGRNLKTVNT